MITERLESMSPRGFLRLIRQDDGDVVLTVGQDNDGDFTYATIEFCTPFGGRGGSRRTYIALVQLAAAMAADNLDQYQAARRPPELNEDEQKAFVEWGKQCRIAAEGE